jgi:eukaryotic-like serine/threonine-protein kinase
MPDDVPHDRGLFALATEIRIERMWTPAELERARSVGHDGRIADALSNADAFGVAEYLAAGTPLAGQMA